MARWQVEYFQHAMQIAKENGRHSFDFSDSIYNGISASKPKLPYKLYKFFRPTTQNVLDLLNLRLYLAAPESFNDPFDSVVGVKEHEYIKPRVLAAFKEKMATDERFTQEWFNKISWAPLPDKYNDWSNSKHPNYEVRIQEFERELIARGNMVSTLSLSCNTARAEFIEIVASMNKKSVIPKRIACFFFGEEEDVLRHTAMWAHYADNGSGYCVEYDLSLIEAAKDQVKLKIDNGDYSCIQKLEWLNKITAGIFPVEYSKRRPRIIRKTLSRKNIGLENERVFWRSCLTKSTSWSKEKEYRLIINEDEILQRNYKVSFPFIKAVHLGYRMDMGIRRDIITSLKAKAMSLPIYEYRPSPEEYLLVPQLFDQTARWQEGKIDLIGDFVL